MGRGPISADGIVLCDVKIVIVIVIVIVGNGLSLLVHFLSSEEFGAQDDVGGRTSSSGYPGCSNGCEELLTLLWRRGIDGSGGDVGHHGSLCMCISMCISMCICISVHEEHAAKRHRGERRGRLELYHGQETNCRHNH